MNKKKVMERITAVLLIIFTIMMNVPTVYANDNVQIINITECEPAESISMLSEMENDEVVHTLTKEELEDYEKWLEHSELENESENLIKEIRNINENQIALYSAKNSSDECGDKVTYSFDDQTKTLTISGIGDMYNFESGKAPWESIKNSIENVVIENGITTIGTKSFINCINIRTLTMPKTMKTIKFDAIRNCSSIERIDINAEIIEQQSIVDCKNLNEINLSDKVKRIDWGAFINNNKVESITLPSSVESLWAPFVGMNGLKEILVDENNTAFFNDENGILYNKDKSNLKFVPPNIQLESFKVPSTVKNIDPYAFWDNKMLNNIIFLETVEVSSSMLSGSDYLNSWNNESNIYNYQDNRNNNYLIINGTLLDLNVSDDVLDLTGNFNRNGVSTNIKSVDLIKDKNYPNIKNIISNNEIHISAECLNGTEWYNENGINTIYSQPT